MHRADILYYLSRNVDSTCRVKYQILLSENLEHSPSRVNKFKSSWLNKITILTTISGTVALCSLLTGSVISRFYDPALAPLVLGTGSSNGGNSSLGSGNQSTPVIIDEETMKIDLPNHVKIAIAASLCLMVGLVQVSKMRNVYFYVNCSPTNSRMLKFRKKDQRFASSLTSHLCTVHN